MRERFRLRTVYRVAFAEINDVRGLLVWDSILWHEISFYQFNGRRLSFMNSINAQAVEEKWNELISKHAYATDQEILNIHDFDSWVYNESYEYE